MIDFEEMTSSEQEVQSLESATALKKQRFNVGDTRNERQEQRTFEARKEAANRFNQSLQAFPPGTKLTKKNKQYRSLKSTSSPLNAAKTAAHRKKGLGVLVLASLGDPVTNLGRPNQHQTP